MVGHRVETYAKRMKGKRFSAMLARKLLVLSSFTPACNVFLFPFFLSLDHLSLSLIRENELDNTGEEATYIR